VSAPEVTTSRKRRRLFPRIIVDEAKAVIDR
jgi:hypothetical protein